MKDEENTLGFVRPRLLAIAEQMRRENKQILHACIINIGVVSGV